MALSSGGLYLGRVHANLSHLGGLVHLAGSNVVWAGTINFGGKSYLFSGGFGPFWRVQSYVIHCTSEFNRHRQTTLRVYRGCDTVLVWRPT